MAMPALLMRTSSVSTSSTARWICEPLVTSSVRGVTRSSGCCRAPRVPAYTFFAPRRSASSRRARPIPRLAPVIKTDLFEIFMTFSFVDSPFEFRTSKTQAENPFSLTAPRRPPESAHQHLPFCGIACDSCQADSAVLACRATFTLVGRDFVSRLFLLRQLHGQSPQPSADTPPRHHQPPPSETECPPRLT